MKILVNIIRVLVGVLFIFSGLVKANDPLGLSYKMQEFFELWGMEALNHLTLAFSILIIAFEIIAGIALLLGWKFRLFSWLLLALIIFFTFLTGYAYLSGKFTNCGCFGDCIPITPLTSFTKDIILLLLVGFLFFYRGKIRPVFSPGGNIAWIIAGLLFSFGFQWYVLNYLPVTDCLPFKKGNNILQQMKPPAGAVPDSFAIRYIYEKNGKRFEFSPAELPSDYKTYTYIDRLDKLVRKGNAEPPIKGFALIGETGADSTAEVLTQPYAILVFTLDIASKGDAWRKKLLTVNQLAQNKNVPVYLITTEIDVAKQQLSGSVMSDLPVFACDFTAIRTAARTDPCYYLLSRGTIINKWSQKTVFGLEYTLSHMKPMLPLVPDAGKHSDDSLSSQEDTLQH